MAAVALALLATVGGPAPPAVRAATTPFTDIAGTTFEHDIEWLWAGDAGICAADPVSGVDQRGLPRTPPCDIGAYELQP